MAIIPVHPADNLQTKINAATAGDILELEVGGTWDGTFTLPAVTGASAINPVTIRSSAYGSLPNGRVGPSDAINMARIRSLGGGTLGAAFQLGVNAAYWVLDGLELTDNAPVTANISMLIDGTDVTCSHLTVTRCYLHQKETGTNYNRTVQRGIWFEGDTLTAKWNYIFLIGYYYPEVQGGNAFVQMDTTNFLSVGTARNVLMEDNYLSTFWNQFFLGGADSEPENFATLTGATTTSATFSNVTGLTAGIVIRFEFTTTCVFTPVGMEASCNGTFPSNGPPNSTGTQLVRTSGYALNSGDTNRYGKIKNAADVYDLLIGVCSVSGNNYTIAKTRSTSNPTAGTVTLTVYETAMVTSVVGNTVNYTPFGVDFLASSGATGASWNYGSQGLISDITFRQNTFYVDPAFAVNAASHGYNPKGIAELKTVNNFLFEGNYVLGMPALLALYPANQYGTAPWATVKNATFRSNWWAPITGYPAASRDAMGLIDAGNYATITPLYNISVVNNFFTNVTSLCYMKGGNLWTIEHNTVLNGGVPSLSGYTDTINLISSTAPATNWTMKNNIVGYSAYGIQVAVPPGTIAAGFPSGVFLNNVVVQNNTPNSGPIHCGASSEWGSGAALCPVQTSFAGVGFTDMANDNYKLLPSSPYYHAGTDGTDPGVDWATLIAALPQSPSSTQGTSISGQVTVTGPVVIGG